MRTRLALGAMDTRASTFALNAQTRSGCPRSFRLCENYERQARVLSRSDTIAVWAGGATVAGCAAAIIATLYATAVKGLVCDSFGIACGIDATLYVGGYDGWDVSDEEVLATGRFDKTDFNCGEVAIPVFLQGGAWYLVGPVRAAPDPAAPRPRPTGLLPPWLERCAGAATLSRLEASPVAVAEECRRVAHRFRALPVSGWIQPGSRGTECDDTEGWPHPVRGDSLLSARHGSWKVRN